MARLNVNLLGPVQIIRDQRAVSGLESNKARGLLAYLAVEHRCPHRRDALADLFWPERTIEAASGNLRRVLANLRTVLEDRAARPPHLVITRETVQFNLASDVAVDVVRLSELIKIPETQPGWANQLEQAVTLYAGPFLDGFHLDDCPEFELWMTSVRDDLERLAASAFYRLARQCHSQGEIEGALPLYRRSLALNQYNEAAQRGFMAALALTGQRHVALRHYAAYRRELLDELGAELEAQTVELAEAIQQGRFETAGDALLVARPSAQTRAQRGVVLLVRSAHHRDSVNFHRQRDQPGCHPAT